VSEELESVVLVPALGVGPLVLEQRMRHDPSAAAGVPPHVTLMFPFIPPTDLTDGTIETLEKLIAETRAFQFALTGAIDDLHGGFVFERPVGRY
jgi:hypothetical protein